MGELRGIELGTNTKQNVGLNLTPISFWSHSKVNWLLKKDSDIGGALGCDQCAFKGRVRNSAIYSNQGTRETTTIYFLEDEYILVESGK